LVNLIRRIATILFTLLESDADDEAVESNGVDDVKAIGLGPDRTVTSMVFDPSNPTSNTPTTVELTVKNIGAEGASPSASRLYKSKNGKLDGADTLLRNCSSTRLSAGATAMQSTTVTLPAGTCYVRAVSDASNAVAEASESNNLKKARKTVPKFLCSRRSFRRFGPSNPDHVVAEGQDGGQRNGPAGSECSADSP
jgi:hypothetical protein